MIMMRKKRFKKAVEEFAAKANAPFTADDAVRAIEDQVTKLPRDAEIAVEETLDENEDLFVDCTDDGEPLFVPRQHFFRGGRFRLVPLESELQGGYLVPGHRFTPFCSRGVFPPQCRLELEDGSTIPVRRVRLAMADGGIFFSMMRPDDFIGYLVIDDPKNEEALKGMEEGGGLVEWSLSVFDMTEAYRRTGFQPGDAFVAEVVSWRDGHYRLQRMAKADLEPYRFSQARWFDAIEREILAENEDGVAIRDPCEQVAQALFFGCGSEALQPPGLHVGGLIGAMKSLALTSMGHGVVLWEKGKNPADSFIHAPELSGSVASLEAILKDLAVSYGEAEVEAFMRDELFRGGRSLDAVRKRILAGRLTVFLGKEQEQQFGVLLEELWEEVHGGYDAGADAFWGPYRTEALRILDQATDVIRGMDRAGLAPAEIPSEELIAFTVPVSIMTDLVISMNAPSEDEGVDPGQLRELLNAAGKAVGELATAIQAKTRPKRGRKRNPPF